MELFIMHSDHKHAWLEVSADYAIKMLNGEVSNYSYISDDLGTVFLEEDCDATLFIKALDTKNVAYDISEHWHDGDCFVRQLNRFDPLRLINSHIDKK
jgi:hypothetical protein